jgi:amino acid adenylation domain-containing protein
VSGEPRDFTLSLQKRALLERLRHESGSPATGFGRIERREVDGPPPLSFAQERLWFLWQLQPDSPFYNVPQAARFRGPLRVDVLVRAFGEIILRHEALRTTFALENGRPIQVIGKAAGIEPTLVDLSEEPQTAREMEAMRRVEREAQRPFDLTRGPLFRLILLRLGPEDHVCLVVLHHIVSDGWSGALLLQELSALYDGFLRGEPPSLPKLPIQYADFAVWQRRWLTGSVLDRQLDYWKTRLAGRLPVLELPTDRPRPREQSFHGAHLPFGISRASGDALSQLGRREGATLFMTLLAAFHVLLHRYTGQEDQIVGSFIANRNRVEIENMIGFFANTLVLRNDLSGDPTFLELLSRVRETTLEAYAHQDLPFEKLVGELRPERDPARHPLFQVMFILQNVPAGHLELSETRTEIVGLETGTSRFDLTLCVVDEPGDLHGWCEYATDLYSEATIERLLTHWETLVDAIVQDPSLPISRLPLLRAEESSRILRQGSGAAAGRSEAGGVHELFVEQARRTPEAVAVASETEELSYAELLRRSKGLAARLRARGVGPDVIVGLSLERSADMVVAVLGTMMAGGACLPVDPAWPAERRAFMLDDSGARVMLTQTRLRPNVPLADDRVLCVDAPVAPADDHDRAGPCPPTSPENLAYVIYTSGSTGRPKGVGMPHRSLLNLVEWHQSAPWTSSRTLQFASLSFDVGFQEIFSTLRAGGTLVLVPERVRFDAAGLGVLVDRWAVERAHLPNVVLQRLAEELAKREGTLLTLREIMVGGEQLRVTPAIAALFRRLPRCRLDNHYGPTETHVITSHPLDPDPGAWPALPPIGRPIANTALYILDRRLQPVPVGIAGELYVGGDCLARGYLNGPDATAEKFVPDPFGRDPGGRLYRTGDVVRWATDGTAEFVGRIDEQVKIRGVRIEPGEIEVLIGRHPAVGDAAVVVREDTRGERRLVAFYVPSQGRSVDPKELRTYLRDSLPEAMLPSQCVPLAAFPRTPSGKVDRRALPPTPMGSGVAHAEIAPRTDLERTLAAIWAEVLSTEAEAVGIHDDFFAFGGHSLLATLLLSRIQQRLGTDVALPRFFDTPTIAGLTACIEGAPPSSEKALSPISSSKRTGSLDGLLQEIEALPDPIPPGRTDRP